MMIQGADQARQQAIRIACIRRGISASKIAKMLKAHRSAVAHVIAGRSRSERIEAALAEIFPDVIQTYPFSDHAERVSATQHVDYCAEEQAKPAPQDELLDQRLREARDLTLRQRELLSAVRAAGGRANLRDLHGFAPHAVVRVAQALRDRGYLAGRGEIVDINQPIELAPAAGKEAA